ncbi:MAG: tetratricopeptide repeat protein [Chloroflexi bacterium]|nr:tetratricopeptide repeat protein [Chloroflexota bacterium]
MRAKQDEVEDLKNQLQASAEQQRRESAQATLALSLLPLGERQYRAQDFNGALDTYQRALQMNTENPVIHYRIGYIHVQSGQLDDAEHHLLEALRIDPSFAPALAALGYVYRRKGEQMKPSHDRDKMLNRAESKLLEALEISPKLVDDDDESWWGSLGSLYRRRGQIDEAIRAYEAAAEVTPHSSYPFSNLALLKVGDRDAMIDAYRRVERLARAEALAQVDNYWGYADLLTAQLALGKTDEAADTLITVFDTVPPNSPYALDTLREALERLVGALGGPERAPHIGEFIARIRQHPHAKNTTVTTSGGSG